MGLPSGNHCYYRPKRSKAREYTATDCGRIVRYAREAGELEAAICEAISTIGELKCAECDCERIKTFLKILGPVLAIAAAIALRNQSAAKQAADAIAKAQASSRVVAGRIEIIEAAGLMAEIEIDSEQILENLAKGEEARLQLLETGFKVIDEGEVIIREPN